MTQTMIMQFRDMKKQNPDAVLLFRVGSFYETYEEDAETASEVLGITLTVRNTGENKGVKMAGFPHHALDNYLPRLIRAGHRVAICDQLLDDKTARKAVKKGVTAVLETKTYKIKVSHRDAISEGIVEILPKGYATKKEALDAMEREEGKLVMKCLDMGCPFGAGWATDDIYEIVYKTKDNKQTVSFQVICQTENV